MLAIIRTGCKKSAIFNIYAIVWLALTVGNCRTGNFPVWLYRVHLELGRLFDESKWLGVADCQCPDNMLGYGTVVDVNKGEAYWKSVDIRELLERSVM